MSNICKNKLKIIENFFSEKTKRKRKTTKQLAIGNELQHLNGPQ